MYIVGYMYASVCLRVHPCASWVPLGASGSLWVPPGCWMSPVCLWVFWVPLGLLGDYWLALATAGFFWLLRNPKSLGNIKKLTETF